MSAKYDTRNSYAEAFNNVRVATETASAQAMRHAAHASCLLLLPPCSMASQAGREAAVNDIMDATAIRDGRFRGWTRTVPCGRDDARPKASPSCILYVGLCMSDRCRGYASLRPNLSGRQGLTLRGCWYFAGDAPYPSSAGHIPARMFALKEPCQNPDSIPTTSFAPRWQALIES